MNLNEHDPELEAGDAYADMDSFPFGAWYRIQTSVAPHAYDSVGGRQVTRTWKTYGSLRLMSPAGGGLPPQEIQVSGDLDELRRFHEKLGEAINAADEMFEARMQYQHRRDNP